MCYRNVRKVSSCFKVHCVLFYKLCRIIIFFNNNMSIYYGARLDFLLLSPARNFTGIFFKMHVGTHFTIAKCIRMYVICWFSSLSLYDFPFFMRLFWDSMKLTREASTIFILSVLHSFKLFVLGFQRMTASYIDKDY